MNLRDRLRAIKAAGPTPQAPRPSPHGLPGQEVATTYGPAWVIESRYPLASLWGHYRLDEVLGVGPVGWQRLGFAGLRPRQAAFFDTETTGLSGGAGTRIFLLGLGFFADDTFVIRQYFLRDYPDEPALLAAFATDLGPLTTLVSFNGRSFDWPLLTDRFVMQRQQLPPGQRPHLDLLHLSRRLWRNRLQRCNLGHLEEAILGHRRVGDVPGAEIPGLYFDFLRTGKVAPLLPVFEHNRQDILSMVVLAALLGHLAEDWGGRGQELLLNGPGLFGEDLLGLGGHFEKLGLLGEALGCYETALGHLGGRARFAGLLRLGDCLRRARSFEQAAQVWQEALAVSGFSTAPLVELAKHYEHREKDFGEARSLTLAAIELVHQRRQLGGTATELPELEHRLRRLERKLAAYEG